MTCLTPDLTQPTCRVCLQNNHNEEMSSIFDLDTDYNNLHIYEKIEECSGIKIIRHEKIPSLICRYCCAFLKVSYKFRTICRNSNDYLQEFVVSIPLIPQLEACSQDQYGKLTQENDNEEDGQREKAYSLQPKSTTSNVIKENTYSTLTNSDDLNVEIYEEMWLDGEQADDAVALSENLQVSIEQIQMVVGENGEQCVKLNQIQSSEESFNDTTPSKTLGISSDGAAIISDKNPQSKDRKSKKGKPPHICEICGNIYDRRYTLDAHMRRHREEKPYECELCGQAFHCNFELTRHIRKHTGSRPYTCTYCNRNFGDRSTLMKHERIHRNERPYTCETCGKTFTYSSVLKSHLLTHTGERPYICNLCGNTFSRSHHLRAHLETLQHQNDPRSKVLIKQIKRAAAGVQVK